MVTLPGLRWNLTGRSESQLVELLLPYCLSICDLFALGYPMPIIDARNFCMIYFHPINEPSRCFFGFTNHTDTSPLDGNKFESSFNLNELSNFESDTKKFETTSKVLLSKSLLDIFSKHVYPIYIPFYMLCISAYQMWITPQNIIKECARCKSPFLLFNSPCTYHPGKLIFRSFKEDKVLEMWTCCDQFKNGTGCTNYYSHVWYGISKGFNGPIGQFLHTMPSSPNSKGTYGVYALDCEMVFTINGMEVARVTLVDINGEVIYDSYVQPKSTVIDYNTRYSGITKEDLKKPSVKDFDEMRNELLGFINSYTILIGHGLNNDLRVLKICHLRVIDTSVIYPHYKGYPFKYTLKMLSKKILNLDIQSSISGHCSREDSWAAMQLALKKVLHNYYS